MLAAASLLGRLQRVPGLKKQGRGARLVRSLLGFLRPCLRPPFPVPPECPQDSGHKLLGGTWHIPHPVLAFVWGVGVVPALWWGRQAGSEGG